MRLLFVIDNLGPGGAQRQLALLACGLAARGHDVDVFVYYPQSSFQTDLTRSGVRIHTVVKRSRFDLAPLWGLRRLLVSTAYDAAVAFMRTPSLYLLASKLTGRAVPVVSSERVAQRDGSFTM